jgi:GTPase SAR1 family protein
MTLLTDKLVDTKLREYYEKDNRLTIKRLSGEILDMEQCYVNLSIIEYQHKNQDTKLQAAPPSSGFSLLNRLKITAETPESEVTLPDLFRDRKLPEGQVTQPRRILIRGRAGVGKTTLCKKIVHDFYYQQMWATLFDRVIWIPLRRLKGVSSLDEFFRRDYFSFQAERDELVSKLWKTVFDQTHKRTLWLLDGLDEISGYRHSSGTDLIEIFNNLLNQDNVVISSRPYAVKIAGLARFDLQLEAVGFHPSQVQTYLANTIKDPDIADQIRSFIRSHWLIQGLVRIPVQLDALCYSWNKTSFHSGGLPRTMTEIYQAIELRLWRKDILNLEKSNNGGWLSETVVQNLRTRVQIQSLVETEMRFLECLAFTGLYSDIIEFHQGHRDWLYEQPQFRQMSDDVLDRLSFLRTSDASGPDKSYHFLHLTFQEFFAAQYFVRCLISECSERLLCLKGDCLKGKYMKLSPEKFLQEEKYGGRYDVFWRFVTGLLHNIDEEKVSSFLKKIQREPQDLLGPAHQRLLMHCFSEIPQSELAGNGNDFLRCLRDKMELGCIHWSRYEERSLKEMRLCSETEFPEHVLCKLLEEDFIQRKSPHRKKVLRALANRWHMSSELIGIISKFLDDSDWYVRHAAIKALGTQSPWSPETLQAVTCRLDHSDWHVREAAIEALGRQSPWSPETLQAVICRLDDSDWTMASKIEALLWKHDDFLSPLLHLHVDAVSALGKIWVQRSIHETFVCYVWDGNVYFETSDGRRSLPSSRKKSHLLQHTLWAATLNSPKKRFERLRLASLNLKLRLATNSSTRIIKGRNPFSGLRN